MFFDSNFFWFLMGVLFILAAAGFRAFAKDRGWIISWWKAALALLWYAIFALSFYAYGTLIGENETIRDAIRINPVKTIVIIW